MNMLSKAVAYFSRFISGHRWWRLTEWNLNSPDALISTAAKLLDATRTNDSLEGEKGHHDREPFSFWRIVTDACESADWLDIINVTLKQQFYVLMVTLLAAIVFGFFSFDFPVFSKQLQWMSYTINPIRHLHCIINHYIVYLPLLKNRAFLFPIGSQFCLKSCHIKIDPKMHSISRPPSWKIHDISVYPKIIACFSLGRFPCIPRCQHF